MKYKWIIKFLRLFYRFKKAPTDNFVTNGLERCVICGKETKISASKPITLRECYEVGCGQLCISCYQNLRNVNEKDNRRLSEQQLSMVLEQSRVKVKKRK